MKKRKYLTGHEIDRLLNISLNGVNGVRDYCLVYLAFTHGLRVSELCSLRVSDIDLDAKTIYIYRLKNGFSTVHPLRDKEIFMLRKWLAVREKINVSGSDFLFISMKGGGYQGSGSIV